MPANSSLCLEACCLLMPTLDDSIQGVALSPQAAAQRHADATRTDMGHNAACLMTGGMLPGGAAGQQAANEALVGPVPLSEGGRQLALASCAEGICDLGANRSCLFINAAGTAMQGYRPGELVGKDQHALDVLSQITERHRRQVETVKDGKGHAQSEEERQRMMGCLVEADRRRTEFLATLAHELRHPLAPIRNGLALLRMQGGSIDAAPIVEMMERQVSHMACLIDELLDIARITSGKVELKRQRVALNSVIFSAIETGLPLIEAMQHDLVVDLPDDSLMLDADPGRLVQVLVNLLSNAVKYTPEGGRIAISARREDLEAVISVADNGVGIPGESLASVFDMFSQVAPNMHLAQGGLGIGLSLVRQLVEIHGGSVSIASPGVNQGSTFTVRLPLAGESLNNAPVIATAVPPGESAAAPVRGLRILVVDDHAESAGSLAAVLEHKGHGHVVAVANEGRQAVELAKQFKPEVAFLDIDMPGMNGDEVAQALRKVDGLQTLVLVALTGWSGPRGKARSQTAGFDHHLTKPTGLETIDTLLSGIAALLSARLQPQPHF